MNSMFEMIRFYSLLIKIFIIASLCTFSAKAVDVKDLYQASVPVNSQSARDRLIGIKDAMRNVLIKVGGNKLVTEDELMQKAIKQPNQYFLQFRYQTLSDVLHLVVDFDETKINHLFSSAQLPLWGSLRPQILLWFVHENKLSRDIVASSSESEFALQIKTLAKKRGLPVIFPLMDLEDITNISVVDLWGRFAEPVSLTSQRYFPEKIVIIRMSNHSLVDTIETPENCLVCKKQQYVVDWSIIEEHQHFSNAYKGTEPTELLTEVIDDITGYVYQQYALITSIDNEIFIDIDNISDLSSYAKLYSFFESMTSIENIMLVEVQGLHRRFKLNVLGSKENLIASLKLSKKLIQQIDPLAAKNADDIPVFSWLN